MSRKKQKQYNDDNFNPFAPQREDMIDHTKKLLFTWIFMAAGAVTGFVLGVQSGNIAVSTLFATVMGIALGSALDSRFPREDKKKPVDYTKKK
jgi:hypothetical protein